MRAETDAAPGGAIIRDYCAEDQPAFRALNLAWIKAEFAVEASDLAQLDQPEDTILSVGGAILIAELDGAPVGTLALVPAHGAPDTLELVKMAVSKDAQGRGIGRLLLQSGIERARQMGARRIWLESNTKLAAALKLYRSAGFQTLSKSSETPSPYARCDIQMEFLL